MLEAGCNREKINQILQALDLEKRAELVVEAGHEVLGPLCMLESRDLMHGNQQMLMLFIASVLKKVIERRGAEAVGQQPSTATEGQGWTRVQKLETELEALRKEDEGQAGQLISLTAQWEERKSQVLTNSMSSLSTRDENQGALLNGGKLVDNILRGNCTRPSHGYILTDENAYRLRQIYQSSTNILSVAMAVYGDLRLASILVEKRLSRWPIISGHLRKKDRDALKWRRRFFVLRDNFLLCYPEDASPQAEPQEAYHVDDALVRIMFEVQHAEDPVISVEIASKVNAFYLYLSADAMILSSWKEAITKASAYWISSC